MTFKVLIFLTVGVPDSVPDNQVEMPTVPLVLNHLLPS